MKASRRDVIKWSALTGAALLLRVPLDPGEPVAKSEKEPVSFGPNKWLRVARDGKVTLIAHKSEMGQGVRTALPMILAEELEADWSKIEILHASPGPDFPNMRTSGSGAVISSWLPLRQAGAAARSMLIAAAAQAWSVDPASCRAERGDVVHDATGRRLPYGDLVEAASRLPVPEKPPLKDPKDFRLIGTRVRRVDGPKIVDGTAQYGLDVRVPGMRYATVARCPVPGGKPARWDVARVRAVAGVLDVVPISTGLAVVAKSTWAALKGKEVLEVTWDEGPNRGHGSALYWKRLEQALEEGGRVTRAEGNTAAALASAPKRIEAVYQYPFQAHATVEPMNCVADVRPGGCEIWVGTQAPNQAQEAVAKLLGIPAERVKVNVALLGGGFGRRLAFDYVPEAAELSKAIHAPVQVVWTRQDDIRHGFLHPCSMSRFAAGVDASGAPVAWRHTAATYHLTMFGPLDLNDPGTYEEVPWGGFDIPYEFPALEVRYAPVESPVPTGAWRAVQYPPFVFARESFLDELARLAEKDPLAFRLGLLGRTPNFKLGEQTIDRTRLTRVLRLAAEKAGWGKPLAARGESRRGRGIACNVYHGRTMVAQVAEVSVSRDGRLAVDRVVCAVDCGQIVNLSGLEAQIESGIVWGLSAALRGEITFKAGRVEQSTYRDFRVLRMDETPEIQIHVVESAAHPSGIGEQPVPPVAPAVANAVFAATGERLRKVPLQPGGAVPADGR